jgi:outer membrane protein assembly factor BamB
MSRFGKSYQKGDSFPMGGEESRGRRVDGLLFVGLGKRVIALEKTTGREVWEWTCPRNYGANVTMLVEEGQLFVSANGYIYCLNGTDGRLMWDNPLTGRGLGIAALATTMANNNSHSAHTKRYVQAQQNG